MKCTAILKLHACRLGRFNGRTLQCIIDVGPHRIRIVPNQIRAGSLGKDMYAFKRMHGRPNADRLQPVETVLIKRTDPSVVLTAGRQGGFFVQANRMPLLGQGGRETCSPCRPDNSYHAPSINCRNEGLLSRL